MLLPIHKKTINFLVFIFIYFSPAIALADNNFSFKLTIPYYLGSTHSSVTPGERMQAFFVIENQSEYKQEMLVTIELPPIFSPTGQHDNWQLLHIGDKNILSGNITLTGGYCQWFDLLSLQVSPDGLPGTYRVKITVKDITKEFDVTVRDVISPKSDAFILNKIVLPLDEDGRKDERLSTNTLVVRDRTLDYYKNLLCGKGATNQELETLQPIAYMGLEFMNPAGVQKLSVITARLLDKSTRHPISGLFTPNVDEYKDCLEAFIAFTGESLQTVKMPMYVDEQLLSDGQYILQIVVNDGTAETLTVETPLHIIKSNTKCIIIIGISTVLLLFAMLWWGFHLQSLLISIKTRWIIIIALFGAVSFAVVNVPTTLSWGLFHILLGPFSFLVSGLFNAVLLYSLIISIVMIIPRPGIITLMTAVRLMLGILVFGRISPITFLSYGFHAALLEWFLYAAKVYNKLSVKENDTQFSLKNKIILVLLCGTAESVAAYLVIQSTSFLYRLYYADWYICANVFTNGLLYTPIGTICGLLLGRQLKKVIGD